MKKSILVIALMVFGFLQSGAQDYSKYKIAFRVNPNVGWLVPQQNHIESVGSTLNFGFGINADILFTENYAIGTGFGIENTGGKINYLQRTSVDTTFYIVSKERSYSLKYIEIPLTLKMRTNEIGYITYWGQFGLGLGVNINAKANDRDDYILEFTNDPQTLITEPVWHETSFENTKDDKINIQDEIRLFRPSLIVGGGIEYNLQGTTSIVAGITFNNGFSNVLDGNGIEKSQSDEPVFTDKFNPNGASTEKLKATSNFLAFTVGLLF